MLSQGEPRDAAVKMRFLCKPNPIAGQYATWNCKPLLFRFPFRPKWRYKNKIGLYKNTICLIELIIDYRGLISEIVFCYSGKMFAHRCSLRVYSVVARPRTCHNHSIQSEIHYDAPLHAGLCGGDILPLEAPKPEEPLSLSPADIAASLYAVITANCKR